MTRSEASLPACLTCIDTTVFFVALGVMKEPKLAVSENTYKATYLLDDESQPLLVLMLL